MYIERNVYGDVNLIQVDLFDKEIILDALCDLVDDFYTKGGISPFGVAFTLNDLFDGHDQLFEFIENIYDADYPAEKDFIEDCSVYDRKDFIVNYFLCNCDGVNSLDDFVDLIFDELSARYSN